VAGALGESARTPFPDVDLIFPGPDQIVAAGTQALVRLGVTGARAHAIEALARACDTGQVRLEPGGDVLRTMEKLRNVPGIGDWTAQYIAMRALSWPDAFPAADYGVKKALGETSPARVLARAEAWRPWRAYATLYLWRSLRTMSKPPLPKDTR
jgi:AraC family transcriptional regulator of adaptative response / DNA-3-methyladenine glycosylase II